MTESQNATIAPESVKDRFKVGDTVEVARGRNSGDRVKILGASDVDNTYAVQFEKDSKFAVISRDSVREPAELKIPISALAGAIDKANLASDLPETERLLAELEVVAPGIGALVTTLYDTTRDAD